MFAETDFTVLTSPFLQYGSFGLNVLLLIWFMWKGAPLALEKHEAAVKAVTQSSQAAITNLIDTFKEEANECREERMEVAREAASEREKDRAARHEVANVLMKVEHAIETLSGKLA